MIHYECKNIPKAAASDEDGGQIRKGTETMMDYEVFKNVIAARIKEFLPPLYADFDVNIHSVPKINGVKEAMVLELNTTELAMTAPNIYMDDLYLEFKACGEIEAVLEEAAALIVNFTGTQRMGEGAFDVKDYKNDIIKALINTEKNSALLADVPHREFLDLSVVYRFAVDDGDGGFATAMLTTDLLEELGITGDELEQLAEENTVRKQKTHIVDVAPGARIMTMESVIYGAVNLMRTDEIRKIADEMEDDLFLLPGSIHEIMVLAAGDNDVAKLAAIVKKGNSTSTGADEFLSDSIYYYDRKKDAVSLAAAE